MNRFLLNLRSLVCAVVLSLAAFGMAETNVNASDNCTPRYRYEWVQCYENREVAYTAYETRYDHCNRPYQVEVTRYRTERVQVWRQIAVRVQ